MIKYTPVGFYPAGIFLEKEQFFMKKLALMLILVLSLTAISYAADSDLPVSFDLRSNYGIVPPIKNQGGWGTCWTFPVTAAMETNYLLQVSNDQIASVDALGTTSLDVNLSEMYIAYFTRMGLERKQLFSTVKDKKLVKFPESSDVLIGGNALKAVALMTRGTDFGPVTSKDLPYPVTSADLFGMTIKSHDQYTTRLRITDASFMHVIDNQESYMYKNASDDIKRLIMQKGGVAIVYNHADDGRFMNPDTGAYYYSGPEKSRVDTDKPADETNHVVTVIGWDDNYSVDNFSSADKPANPGAWLIRNSWGTFDESISDDLGNPTGYFWMSYEQFFYDGTAITVANVSPDVKVYEYDDLGWVSTWGGNGADSAVNIFKATNNGEIPVEIGFYTTANDATVDVFIYNYGPEHPAFGDESNQLDLTSFDRVVSLDYNAIVSGEPVFYSEGNYYQFAGYHTLPISVDTSSFEGFDSGDYFGVLIRADNGDGYQYAIATEERSNGDTDYAVAFDGETYFLYVLDSDDYYWINGASNTFPSGDKNIHEPANACIKVLTTYDTTETKNSTANDDIKSIDGVYVEPLPEITISDDIMADIIDETGTKYAGRVITHPVISNDGSLLAQGTSVDIFMTYENEFFENTPEQQSKQGYSQPVFEIDPLYPAGYKPEGYFELDGFYFPVYKATLAVNADGNIEIDADSLRLPVGHYQPYYAAEDSAEGYAVVGQLSPMTITDSEGGDDPEKDPLDPVTPVSPVTPETDPDPSESIGVGSSSSGCNSGLFGAFGIVCALMMISAKKNTSKAEK